MVTSTHYNSLHGHSYYTKNKPLKKLSHVDTWFITRYVIAPKEHTPERKRNMSVKWIVQRSHNRRLLPPNITLSHVNTQTEVVSQHSAIAHHQLYTIVNHHVIPINAIKLFDRNAIAQEKMAGVERMKNAIPYDFFMLPTLFMICHGVFNSLLIKIAYIDKNGIKGCHTYSRAVIFVLCKLSSGIMRLLGLTATNLLLYSHLIHKKNSISLAWFFLQTALSCVSIQAHPYIWGFTDAIGYSTKITLWIVIHLNHLMEFT